MGSDAADRGLAAQYESYPYPARDPRDEAKRLLIGSPSHLREIDHWVFGAARPRSMPLDVLVAGSGTGDAAIMLATHLARAGRAGTVTCLDRSEAAMATVRARAAARKLDNLRFVQGSLMDLPQSLGGAMPARGFDYIDCCGVLHHLPDPAEGLRRLVSVLAPGGGMGLMVYAPHGRTGVYMLQDALRLLSPVDEAPPARLDAARRMMRHLPQTAWLRQNTHFGDHLTGGDAGLYDLLLNPRDVSYTLPQFAALLHGAGLAAAALMEPSRYDPALLLPDARLRARVAGLDDLARAALAEALSGNMNTHVAYVRRTGEMLPAPDALAAQAVPVAREMPCAEIARRIGPDGAFPFAFGRLEVRVPLPAQARAILGLIDGERSVGAIAAGLADRGIAGQAFASAWMQLWAALNGVNQLLLRAPA